MESNMAGKSPRVDEFMIILTIKLLAFRTADHLFVGPSMRTNNRKLGIQPEVLDKVPELGKHVCLAMSVCIPTYSTFNLSGFLAKDYTWQFLPFGLTI